jgi:hypothetical protein
LQRAAPDFILHESPPEGPRKFLDFALDPAIGAAGSVVHLHPGAFTVNASNHALPFYVSLCFERTAPMQVADVLYNPMRLALRRV